MSTCTEEVRRGYVVIGYVSQEGDTWTAHYQLSSIPGYKQRMRAKLDVHRMSHGLVPFGPKHRVPMDKPYGECPGCGAPSKNGAVCWECQDLGIA